MAIWHGEKGRKPTGGKIHLARKKRKYELGREAILTKIGKEKMFLIRTKGGGTKARLVSTEFVNVTMPDKKTVRTKILSVVENPANPHYVRSNIITKGAIVKTELGLVKITSRPSQHGIVNGVLVEGKE